MEEKSKYKYDFKQILNVDLSKMNSINFLCKRLNLKSKTLNTIVASGNSGKTWLIDYLSVCAVNGYKFLNKYEIQKGNVLLIDQEQSEDQTTIRIKRIANGIKGDTSGIFRLEMPKFEEFYNNDFKTFIQELISKNCIKYVFIDSLRRITNADENSSEISAVLEVLKQITKEEDVCVVVIHHEGKSVGDIKQKGRGHSTIYDVPDCQINLSCSKNIGYVLKCGKIRDGIPFKDICYNFKDVGNYISNIDKTDGIEFFEVESLETEQTIEDKIIKLLSENNSTKLNTAAIKKKIGG